MVRADLELNSSPFLDALKRADDAVIGWAGKFQAVLGKFPALFAGVAAAAAAAAGVAFGLKNSLDLGGELSDLSAATGQSVGDLTVLRQAFENAGLGADAVGPLVAKFQKSLSGVNEEGNSTAEALAKLGVSGAEMAEASTVDQIAALQAGFENITDPIERTRLATELFGKSGSKMLAVLGDSGALGSARDQVGGLAGIMEKFAPLFDQIGDALGAMGLKVQQFFAGAMSVIAPRIVGLLDEASKVDLTGLGVAFGHLVDTLLMVLQTLSPIFEMFKAMAGFAGKVFGPEIPSAAAAKTKTPSDKEMEKTFAAAPVSSMQALGGSMSGGGGGAVDPIVAAQQRSEKILERIAANTAARTPSQEPPKPPPV